MANRVREPIQVYLTEGERARLDRVAAELGVSRSEVLRRGLEGVSAGRPADGPLRELVEAGVVAPARTGSAEPPPRAGGLSLEQVMRGLEADRADR